MSSKSGTSFSSNYLSLKSINMASGDDLTEKRHHSELPAEDTTDIICAKRGKVSDDFDSYSIIGSTDDDSRADQMLDLNKSFADDIQSLSPMLAEPSEINELAESIHILGESQYCLNEDVVLLSETVTKLNRNIIQQQNQINSLMKLLHQTVAENKALQKRTQILSDELGNIQKVTDTSTINANADGTYVWKITNFTEKLAKAIAEEQTSIYSPPFYSSPNGYRMCMRLYLHGDGQARRTHLSLFFVILRGEYDAVLPWPFTHRVIFSLLDQTPAKRHMVDCFRPDPASNSFQRPRSAMNIASGIPKFFPLNVVQQNNNPYVRDDCMFIRCVVDFDSIPKKCLNKICTHNLALPLVKREREIQEIISKTDSNDNEKQDKQQVNESGEEQIDRSELMTAAMEITTQ